MQAAPLFALKAASSDHLTLSLKSTPRAAVLPSTPATGLAGGPPWASVRPLFIADWLDTVMIHLAVSRRVLQPAIPLALDTLDGDGFVTLVGFRQRRLRPAWPAAGALRAVGAALMRPLAAHDFLNVRTYVKQRGVAGIYFIAEVLSSRLATWLGPLMYGLPYSYGQVQYRHDLTGRELTGAVVQAHSGRRLEYRAELPRALTAGEVAGLPVSAAGSIDEFLMERYVAFTHRGGVQRRFRIRHAPWQQTRVAVELQSAELAAAVGGAGGAGGAGGWWPCAKLAFANASPGVTGVEIGAPEI